MGEAGNTGSKGTSHIRIDESHLRCLIIILVMHILNNVQRIYIKLCQPVHHGVILLDHLIVIQILRSNRLIWRSYLYFGL